MSKKALDSKDKEILKLEKMLEEEKRIKAEYSVNSMKTQK